MRPRSPLKDCRSLSPDRRRQEVASLLVAGLSRMPGGTKSPPEEAAKMPAKALERVAKSRLSVASG